MKKMQKYLCNCGNDSFRIFPDYLECAACGQKYDDSAQPTPEEFNADQEHYFYQVSGIYETTGNARAEGLTLLKE
ncbi:MAG: hypothetical protein R2941_17425 [Desulfobacterales bacterium]